MNDEEAKELAKLCKRVLRAEDAIVKAIEARNSYMRTLYAGHRATPLEMAKAMVRRDGEPVSRETAARIVKGARPADNPAHSIPRRV